MSNTKRYNTNTKNGEIKFDSLFYLIAILFWVCHFFGSIGAWGMHEAGINVGLQLYLNSGIGGVFLSPKELSLLLLLLYPIIKFKGYYSKNREFPWIFLFFTIITIILCFVNPNNFTTSSNFVKLFLGGFSRRVFLFILFIYSFFRLDNYCFTELMKRLFKIGTFIFASLSIIYLLRLFLGLGFDHHGMSRAISQYDILLWFGLFHTIYFALFLIYSKRIYFIVSLLFIALPFMSLSRTNTMVPIIADLIVIIFYFMKIRGKIKTAINVSLVIVSTIFIIIFIGQKYSLDIGYYLNRQISTFSYFIDKPIGRYQTFSGFGHVEQSIEATKTMLHNLDTFWGSGIKNRAFPVQGGSHGGYTIHCSFVYAWAKQGLFMTIFLLYLFSLNLKGMIIFFKKKVTLTNSNYVAFQFCMFTLGFMIIASGWCNGDVTYIFRDTIRMMQFLLIYSMTKIDLHTFTSVFGTNTNKRI